MKKPSLAKKLVNFSKAVLDHTLDNLSIADETTQNERLEKCTGCEFREGMICKYNSDEPLKLVVLVSIDFAECGCKKW